MQTIPILRRLIHSIQHQPSVAASVPWDDIQACILAEYECCAGIYPSSQLQSIQQLLNGILSDARQAYAKTNASAAIDSLEKMIFALEFLPEAEHIDSLLQIGRASCRERVSHQV